MSHRRAPKTYAIIEECLPSVLANIVYEYAESGGIFVDDLIRCGLYEECDNYIKDYDDGATHGDPEIMSLILSKGKGILIQSPFLEIYLSRLPDANVLTQYRINPSTKSFALLLKRRDRMKYLCDSKSIAYKFLWSNMMEHCLQIASNENLLPIILKIMKGAKNNPVSRAKHNKIYKCTRLSDRPPYVNLFRSYVEAVHNLIKYTLQRRKYAILHEIIDHCGVKINWSEVCTEAYKEGLIIIAASGDISPDDLFTVRVCSQDYDDASQYKTIVWLMALSKTASLKTTLVAAQMYDHYGRRKILTAIAYEIACRKK